jgi:hypothetical protein
MYDTQCRDQKGRRLIDCSQSIFLLFFHVLNFFFFGFVELSSGRQIINGESFEKWTAITERPEASKHPRKQKKKSFPQRNLISIEAGIDECL